MDIQNLREPEAKGVALIAKGDLEPEHLPIQERSCLLFIHAQEIFQVMRVQVFPKTQRGRQGM